MYIEASYIVNWKYHHITFQECYTSKSTCLSVTGESAVPPTSVVALLTSSALRTLNMRPRCLSLPTPTANIRAPPLLPTAHLPKLVSNIHTPWAKQKSAAQNGSATR